MNKNKSTRICSASRWRGDFYERKALSYLRQQGLLFVCKNYHSRFGEIDLVLREKPSAQEGNQITGLAPLVFVEVRFRRERHQKPLSQVGVAPDRIGYAGEGQAGISISARESISPAKIQRIVRTAQCFLQKNRAYANLPCRFDVMACSQYKMEWIKNAFSG